MKVLELIRFIAENDAEFLSIIGEIDSWRESEGITRFNASLARKSYQFTRDEHRQTLDLACQALRDAKTHQQNRRTQPRHLHCFSDKKLWIPNLNAAKRLIRNDNLFQKWRQGSSYAKLSEEFGIKERWIRAIITIILKQRNTIN